MKRKVSLAGLAANKIASGVKAYAKKSGLTQSPMKGLKQAAASYKAGRAAKAKKTK